MVFVKGKLSPKLMAALAKLRRLPVCEAGWSVRPNAFKKYPDGVSMCNALRHVMPEKAFAGYRYVYITDIDFIAFRHKKTHLDYFKIEMDKSKQPYAGFRGPVRGFRRRGVTVLGWTGAFTRISSGNLMLKGPQWFKKTRSARRKYAAILKRRRQDPNDRIRPASYREYDEVMLYRICAASKLKTPKREGCTLSNKPFNRRYRDIHLGDFKFKKRLRKKGLIHKDNIKAFKELQDDQGWGVAEHLATTNQTVRRRIHNMKEHVNNV